MENEGNHSISDISNKENNYKFDNYGNVMADSIEDLLYDKYLRINKPMEKNNSKKISKSYSSSITEQKEKEDDITISKNINLQNEEKSSKKNSSSSKEILDLINEDKKSDNNDDRFLDSINHENESDIHNNSKNEEISKNNEEFVNTIGRQDEYPKEKELEDEHGANNEIKLILNINKDNKDMNKFYKYNENSDEISKESNNNNRASESTKVNSKKSKKNDGKKLKILQNKNGKKFISNVEGIKDKNNYIIKLNLNLNDSKDGNKNFYNQLIPNYTNKILSNIINNCYFCTKELKYNDDTYKYKDKYKNNNDSDLRDNKNNKDKFLNENPQMYAELDLDKYRQPSNIKIRITNPYYHLFKNNIFKNYQTHSLKKMHKSKSTKDILDKDYHIKKPRKKNIEVIKLNNQKSLGPVKVKRNIISNNNTINKYLTKNDFNHKNDNKTNISDYKYFHNKEIYNAFAHKGGKKCDACLSILNQKRQEGKKHLISNRKLNLKHNPSSRNIQNMKLYEQIYMKNNYINEKNAWDKNNCHSSSIQNKKRKNKKNKSSKRKNHSNKDSSYSSTNYANVIKIEFPLLKSYFH